MSIYVHGSYARRGTLHGSEVAMNTITIQFDDLDEAHIAYNAIERLLHDMGQIGTLSMVTASCQQGVGCGDPSKCPDPVGCDIKEVLSADICWQPASTIPNDDTVLLAKTADGRMLVWRGSILRHQLSRYTPEHLRFPIIGWIDLKDLAKLPDA